MNHGIRQADTLPVALGKIRDDLALHVPQIAEVEHVRDALLQAAAGDFLQRPPVGQILAHAHVGVEGGVFGQVADVLPGAQGIRKDIITSHFRATGRRRQVAGQHLHRGAFARAIGAEKADDFALGDFETDLVHRRHAAIALGKVFNFDHREPS